MPKIISTQTVEVSEERVEEELSSPPQQLESSPKKDKPQEAAKTETKQQAEINTTKNSATEKIKKLTKKFHKVKFRKLDNEAKLKPEKMTTPELKAKNKVLESGKRFEKIKKFLKKDKKSHKEESNSVRKFDSVKKILKKDKSREAGSGFARKLERMRANSKNQAEKQKVLEQKRFKKIAESRTRGGAWNKKERKVSLKNSLKERVFKKVRKESLEKPKVKKVQEKVKVFEKKIKLRKNNENVKPKILKEKSKALVAPKEIKSKKSKEGKLKPEKTITVNNLSETLKKFDQQLKKSREAGSGYAGKFTKPEILVSKKMMKAIEKQINIFPNKSQNKKSDHLINIKSSEKEIFVKLSVLKRLVKSMKFNNLPEGEIFVEEFASQKEVKKTFSYGSDDSTNWLTFQKILIIAILANSSFQNKNGDLKLQPNIVATI